MRGSRVERSESRSITFSREGGVPKDCSIRKTDLTEKEKRKESIEDDREVESRARSERVFGKEREGFLRFKGVRG